MNIVWFRIFTISYGIPILVQIFVIGLEMLVQSNYTIANSIYWFPGYLPLWFKSIFIFVNLGMNPLLMMFYMKGRSKFAFGIITTSLIMCLILGTMEAISWASIDQDGISYRSPYTYFKTEKILWSGVNSPVDLEIVDSSSKSRASVGGLFSIKARSVQRPFNMRFRISDYNDRTKLLEVLSILKQNNVEVKTRFDYMARSAIRANHDRVMSMEYIKRLRSLSNVETYDFLPLP